MLKKHCKRCQSLKVQKRVGGVAQVVECLPSKCEFKPQYCSLSKNIYKDTEKAQTGGREGMEVQETAYTLRD
jgi:hypothetical protein